MVKNIFIWLLIILLLVSVGVVGLELYGQNQFKPSVRFGLSDGQNFDEVNKKLDQINEKLDDLQNQNAKNIDNSSQSQLQDTRTQNNSIDINQNPTLQTEALSSQKSFEKCVSDLGTDENAAVATLRSNLCKIDGKNLRPNIFDLSDELLTYVETISSSSGSKLSNSLNETYTFGGGDSSLFDLATVKAGDRFKVSAKVINNNGVYSFQNITKVEKVSQ